MREFDGNSLTKRLQDAKRAKQARLQKATQAPKNSDPAVVERRTAERASAQARPLEAKRKEAKAEAARKLAARDAVEKAAQVERAERNARNEAQARAEQDDLARIAARAAEEQNGALAVDQKAGATLATQHGWAGSAEAFAVRLRSKCARCATSALLNR